VVSPQEETSNKQSITSDHKTGCREILDDFSRRGRTLAMHAICAVLSLLDAAAHSLNLHLGWPTTAEWIDRVRPTGARNTHPTRGARTMVHDGSQGHFSRTRCGQTGLPSCTPSCPACRLPWQLLSDQMSASLVFFFLSRRRMRRRVPVALAGLGRRGHSDCRN
jgi:hypothetical protein